MYIVCSYLQQPIHLQEGQGNSIMINASLSVKWVVQVWNQYHICILRRNSTSILSTCPTSAADWFIKYCAMCCHAYVTMQVKNSQLSVVRAGHRVPLSSFCLPLYSLRVLNGDINIFRIKIQILKTAGQNPIVFYQDLYTSVLCV